jgi:hypothetical protein
LWYDLRTSTPHILPEVVSIYADYTRLVNRDPKTLTPHEFHTLSVLQRDLLLYQLVMQLVPDTADLPKDLQAIKAQLPPAVHGLSNAQLGQYLGVTGPSHPLYPQWVKLLSDRSAEAQQSVARDANGLPTPYSPQATVDRNLSWELNVLMTIANFVPVLENILDVVDLGDAFLRGDFASAALIVATLGFADRLSTQLVRSTIGEVGETAAQKVIVKFLKEDGTEETVDLLDYFQKRGIDANTARKMTTILATMPDDAFNLINGLTRFKNKPFGDLIQTLVNEKEFAKLIAQPKFLERFMKAIGGNLTDMNPTYFARLGNVLLSTPPNALEIPLAIRLATISGMSTDTLETLLKRKDITNDELALIFASYSPADIQRKLNEEGLTKLLRDAQAAYDPVWMTTGTLLPDNVQNLQVEFLGYDPRMGYVWSDGGTVFGRHSPEQAQVIWEQVTKHNNGNALTVAGSMGETTLGVENRVKAHEEFRAPFDAQWKADNGITENTPLNSYKDDLDAAWKVSPEAQNAFKTYGTPWWRLPTHGGAPTATLPTAESDLDMWFTPQNTNLIEGEVSSGFANSQVEAEIRRVYGYPNGKKIDDYGGYPDWFTMAPAGSLTFMPDGTVRRNYGLWQMPAEYTQRLATYYPHILKNIEERAGRMMFPPDPLPSDMGLDFEIQPIYIPPN